MIGMENAMAKEKKKTRDYFGTVRVAGFSPARLAEFDTDTVGMTLDRNGILKLIESLAKAASVTDEAVLTLRPKRRTPSMTVTQRSVKVRTAS
jgi:hypothetical protein